MTDTTNTENGNRNQFFVRNLTNMLDKHFERALIASVITPVLVDAFACFAMAPETGSLSHKFAWAGYGAALGFGSAFLSGVAGEQNCRRFINSDDQIKYMTESPLSDEGTLKLKRAALKGAVMGGVASLLVGCPTMYVLAHSEGEKTAQTQLDGEKPQNVVKVGGKEFRYIV